MDALEPHMSQRTLEFHYGESLLEALISSLSTTDCDPLRKCICSMLLGSL
jgi:hypothetical protein